MNYKLNGNSILAQERASKLKLIELVANLRPQHNGTG